MQSTRSGGLGLFKKELRRKNRSVMLVAQVDDGRCGFGVLWRYFRHGVVPISWA
jgi:hypothetical protein